MCLKRFHKSSHDRDDTNCDAREGIVPHDFSVFPDSLKGKRILLCTESFGPVNGVSRTTLMLVNHLRSHGALVAVVAPHNHTKHNTFVANKYSSSSSSSDEEEEDSQIELRIHGYPLPFNPELSIVYPVRMRQRPAERQIPIICNFQTDLAGYCAILFPRPLSDVAVYTFATVQSYLFRHKSVKTVLYPSRFVRRYLEAQGVQDDKLEVLRRGVNTELFHPDRRSEALRREIAPDGEVILICVSRIAGEKGFDFLARAAKLLHDRGLRFKLYIVGGNRNAEVEREIQGLFEPLVEKGKVLFAGFQVGEELAAAYASGDVFLHCSVTETFGLVVLESMASGCPSSPGTKGAQRHRARWGSGYLVPPDDLEQFVRRVAEVVEDGELRARLGAE
ncbi:unnamed protein product [Parascedosporium putredinis]|uniref:Glycosyltransferase n=1 Tax=Parascedosporium putredinis TaxID=1442378 RepID=A0A9P1GZF5_9PEZI|nr:unnamed protein product [Parascedosporium putredinis]CAI7991645.1 unnamed protein product [Parascedosporium putredinis]